MQDYCNYNTSSIFDGFFPSSCFCGPPTVITKFAQLLQPPYRSGVAGPNKQRPETNEERALKEEINLLKVDLKETEAKINDELAKSLSEKISQMERDLELLTAELDDKVRFGQRPGSGAGRVTAPPPTNVAEGSQITEPMERPCSRGSIEQYPKPMEQRWGFQGSRDRSSFGGNRSSDRSTTGQRW